MKLKLEHADIIKKIVRMQNGQADVIIRVFCPFCRTKMSLLLIGRTGKYECQACCKHGKLTDLLIYFEDLFERKHRKTIKTMTERSAVDL